MLLSIVSINTKHEVKLVYLRRLRDLREDLDLKQADIANILGIQQTVYSRYERGFQNIPLDYLVYLADYYKVSVDYILGRTDIKELKK